MKTLKKLRSFHNDVSPAYLPPICHFPSFDENANLPTLEEDIRNEDENWLKETTNMPWSLFHTKKYISPKAVPDISPMLQILLVLTYHFTLLQNGCNRISLTSMDTKS